MKIVTVYFMRKRYYSKLLKAFKNSAKKIMPKIKVEILKSKPPLNEIEDKYKRRKKDVEFAFKKITNYILSSKSKEVIAVCDVDLMFLKPITDIENMSFDIALTVRESKTKYNTGLWFCRPTKKTRIFIKKWIRNTHLLMCKFERNLQYILRQGGIDQAGLFMTLEKNPDMDINIIELPCQEWNATQSEWKYVDEKTRVIHVKSMLREAVFDRMEEIPGYFLPLVKQFHNYIGVNE